MKPTSQGTVHTNMTKFAVCRFSIGLLAIAGFAAAQDQTPHAWRSVNDPLPAALDQAPGQPDQSINAQPDQSQAGNQQSVQLAPPDAPRGQNNAAPPYNAPPYNAAPPYNGPAPNYPAPDNYAVPAKLTVKPGTYVTVRMNQWLSSDRNQQAILSQRPSISRSSSTALWWRKGDRRFTAGSASLRKPGAWKEPRVWVCS